MAKTYGRASEACLQERQPSDPLKWRKFVSYAEFTPPHTPAEAHHIPGYSGHVPGVYAENLYAQTYGKTTLRAIEGNFPKGCDQTPDEQYKTNTQVQFSDEYSHPGKPTDILHGGASWAGGSPYNVEENFDLEPTNPWPPSVVQIAGGKEPTQTSILLKNFPPTGETKEPAMRITPKTDPHDPTDPAKKTMTKTNGHYKIPGYSGFVPGVDSEGIFAATYARTTAAADTIRDRKKEDETYLKTDNINEAGVLLLKPARPPPPTANEMPTTATDGPSKLKKHVPGYTGFVPGVQAETMFGNTYGHSSHMAIEGSHDRFQWREMPPEKRFESTQKFSYINFGHPAKIEDGHITYEHVYTNPANANYKQVKPPILGEHKSHIPGYGGFVPGVQAKNMYGSSQFETTKLALSNHVEHMKEYSEKKPKTAPAGNPETVGLGMLQFKPNGFLYTKKMQGDWNNGMLGSRNYSAVRLSEGRHWKGNLYVTNNQVMMKGHANEDVPFGYSKGPGPKFENMQHALAHKSTYLGFYAL
jgi:hypothetical protein